MQYRSQLLHKQNWINKIPMQSLQLHYWGINSVNSLRISNLCHMLVHCEDIPVTCYSPMNSFHTSALLSSRPTARPSNKAWVERARTGELTIADDFKIISWKCLTCKEVPQRRGHGRRTVDQEVRRLVTDRRLRLRQLGSFVHWSVFRSLHVAVRVNLFGGFQRKEKIFWSSN